MTRASAITIREFRQADWPAVQRIYQDGIDTKNATFQETVKSWAEWDAGMHPFCRLVAVDGDEVVGWAAISPTSSRAVYAGIAEVSVYVSTGQHGRGIGKQLLSALVRESEAAGIWTLTAGIFPENVASLELHKKCGFRVIGYWEKKGQMDGVWRDVIFLERRSKVVGV